MRNGTILWPGPNGRLFVISPSGKRLATYDIGSFVLTPVVDRTERYVYIQSMSGELSAWSIGRGSMTRRWSLQLEGTSYASPAIAPNGTIRTAAGNDLVAVRDDGDTATELWRFATQDLIEVSPAIGPDGTTIIGSNGSFEYAINPDGTLRWQFEKSAQTYGSSAATPSGEAVFGDHTGRLHTIDIASGNKTGVAFGELKPSRSRSVGIWTSPALGSRS